MSSNDDDDDVRRALEDERAATLERLADLDRDIGRIVEAAESANLDDEHDPEGATIAFERSQLASLRDREAARIAELDAALDRLAAGSYGTCEGCGEAIPPDRLAARPSARLCIRCASRR
jgi:RNA polymerase-binding protein DksA